MIPFPFTQSHQTGSQQSIEPPQNEIQTAIAQALAAQSQQFEAKLQSRDLLIDKLLTKLEEATITNPATPAAGTSTSSSQKKSAPRKSVTIGTATPVKVPSRAVSEPPPSLSKSKTTSKAAAAAPPATPPPRRRPHQVFVSEYPKDFDKTKGAFEIHIRVLWGMLQVKSVLPPADEGSMRFFSASYDDLEAVKKAIDSAATPSIIARSQIQTLRQASMGQIRVARGMITLDTQAILTVHAALSKAGLAVWGPDLTQSHDSLFNAANRYIAISTFREVSSGPCYRYLQVNPKYVDDIGLLTSAYNHYVHYLSAAKFKREVRTPGRLAEAESVKTISQRRRRLAEACRLFASQNNFPRRYKLILEQPYAHSDDELDPELKVHVIKTLEYRSANANKFFRRLDAMMDRVAITSGKTTQRQPRLLPMVPVPSKLQTPPTQLPIDYYSAKWYNALTPSQKEKIVKHNQVALLPDAGDSFIPAPNTHPAEKLNGRDFNKKYHLRLTLPYQINAPAGDSDSEAEDGPAFHNKPLHQVDMSDSIDLQAPSEGSDAEDRAAVNNLFFASGDYGQLYDQDSEDGDWTPDDFIDGDDEEEDADAAHPAGGAPADGAAAGAVPFDTIGDQTMQE